jgi:UTP:GlnB (protein PII) uridylyltransferase
VRKLADKPRFGTFMAGKRAATATYPRSSLLRKSSQPKSTFTWSNNEAAALLRPVMPDFYFVNTPTAHMRRHLELLLQLQHGDVTLDFHRHPGARLTELTLCAFDETRPGLLAKVCGTLTALGIEVRTALIYTLQPPEQNPAHGADTTPPRRWVALDTLLLSEPYRGQERALTSKAIERTRAELLRVIQGETSVAQLLTKMRRHLHAPVNIYDLAVVNRDMGPTLGVCTAISLRSADMTGLLYRTTGALAALELNIQVAQINSENGVAEDLFFVTDAQGAPWPENDLQALSTRLRSMLQSGTLPTFLAGGG